MFIELIDGLRCTADHPSICLVAAIDERDDRQVIEGTLGCPTCRREYPIHGGIVSFTAKSHAESTTGPVDSLDVDGAVRIGAFLAVTEGITIALVGDWARYAPAVADLIGLRAFAINPSEPVTESDRVGVLQSDNRLPFKSGSLRGIAIDASGWSNHDIAQSTHALAAGGRLVAPASAAVPDDIEEIARDDDYWIGEKRGALVALHRR
ncbi:MAG: hypothetical protein ABI035_08810 [Gemmatimonadaceae bacterium]